MPKGFIVPHFFVDPKNISGNQITITGEEAHHLVNVRRIQIKDELNLFDGLGNQYIAKVESLSKDAVFATILSSKKTEKTKIKLNFFHSIPKGERADWLIEKLTELGISSFTPVETERSVVKNISESKIKRWERLVQAACQQSLRPDFMKINPPVSFEKAVNSIDKDAVSIIPWEGEEKESSLQSVFNIKSASVINVFIGPEGGFSFDEIELAKKAGIFPVTLGERILRVETAGILSAILVLNAFGEY